MNVLILGSGGREHCLAWKIKQSTLLGDLFVLPGNAGTSLLATNIDGSVVDFELIAQTIQEKKINLLLVGSEEPLVKGIRDFLENQAVFQDLMIIGPNKEGAQLEGSKAFSKNLMTKYNIPTAKANVFSADIYPLALDYLKQGNFPVVLKADGLAAGKGVVIAQNIIEAEEALKEMLLDKKFGEASQTVLIEQFLDGIELSVFVLTDGKNYKFLPSAKDYKKIGEGDLGLNTGGMGAISPVPFANEIFMQKVQSNIINRTLDALQSEKILYQGFIFFGLINVGGEPFVIEYNARLGDPETQAIVPLIENDFLEVLIACAKGELSTTELKIAEQYSSVVVATAKGYPLEYTKGDGIGLPETKDHTQIFQAGTLYQDQVLKTNGGRVLSVSVQNSSLSNALHQAYNVIEQIDYAGKYYRKDIGQDLLGYL